MEKMNQIASSIVMGDTGEVREQVINHFNGINKVFKDGWNSDTMLHMICREGGGEEMVVVFMRWYL